MIAGDMVQKADCLNHTMWRADVVLECSMESLRVPVLTGDQVREIHLLVRKIHIEGVLLMMMVMFSGQSIGHHWLLLYIPFEGMVLKGERLLLGKLQLDTHDSEKLVSAPLLTMYCSCSVRAPFRCA
jgi:hypothetical protein